MTDERDDLDKAEKALWKAIEDDHGTVMLGAHTHPMQHFQPMTAFCEPESGLIWFFTRADTDLARSIEEGKQAMMVVHRSRYQACVAGELTLQHDVERINKYWNAVVAAWYPEGKDDPRLTMLCLDVQDAQTWSDQAGPIKFAFEIAKANATGTMPDVGQSQSLRLN